MTINTQHVLLIRHGRTALNAEGRIRGLADPELDPTGIEEAHATANALRPLGITRLLSSPLQRAVATARIIAEATDAEHLVDPAFNDRDYGPWTGHVKTEVIQQWGSIDNAPGVEPESGVLARVLQALNALTGNPGSAPITIVTHDAIIRPILASMKPDVVPFVDTGSWAELIHTKDGWAIASIDNTGA